MPHLTFSLKKMSLSKLLIGTACILFCTQSFCSQGLQAAVAAAPQNAQANLMQLDDSNFQRTIANGVVVIDFHAHWCAPCRQFAPTFESVGREMGNQAVFAKVNIDQAKKVAQDYQVSSIPTLILFKDGKEVKRIVGGTNAEALRQFVRSAL